jgi:N-terminal domain of anti-restriction factor ArdC/IrrE N-terminal-like domain
MNKQTNPSSNDITDPQFLGPEAGQRAAGKAAGTAGGAAEVEQAHELGDMRTILEAALTQPGVVNQAYRAFHNYSLGNQMLAALQLFAKGLPLAPIASFNAWREKGRFVKKGEKAISLYMPINVKRRADKDAAATANDVDALTALTEGGTSFSLFILRPNWFSLTQTEGEAFTAESVTPAWCAVTAMAALDIAEEPFEHLRGNFMGYARARCIAINPLNPLKHKTRFHELAHVVLGHTADADLHDDESLTRQIVEVEAESVAYLLCTLLDLPGQAESRFYIQSWMRGDVLPEKSAKRIFGAADRIMKAGQLSPVQPS